MSFMKQGLIPRDLYSEIDSTAIYREMERYSNRFLGQTRSLLRPYARKWGGDPLHAWSRRWEYPFAFEAIKECADAGRGGMIRVLDAGAGITFFPYYLAECLGNVDVICVDYDELLPGLYSRINSTLGSEIRFQLNSIDRIDTADQSFDVVYCISVLEHTRNYSAIIREFKRLLRPGGVMIVSFDVSMNDRADIPVAEAKALLSTLRECFNAVDPEAVEAFQKFEPSISDAIVTTKYINKVHPERLPWVAPRLSGMLGAMRRGVFPWPVMKNIATACFLFTAPR
jgi:ubiquinone/menaquinone biosynthesis C-methylase UbiE